MSKNIRQPIYLDYNSTTPCDSEVVEAMLPFFNEQFGNASSKTHAYGWGAEEAVESAREQIASLIGAYSQDIIFTSGATESTNLAIRGLLGDIDSAKHIITVATEHKAVLDLCYFLESRGVALTILPVDKYGQLDLEALENAINPNTKLIAVMYANNETGVIMPVEQIAAIANKHGVPFFCDATQAVGKIKVDLNEVAIDMMAFSAHKFYGPKGVGALYIRKTTPKLKLTPLQFGGGHERKLRSGTLNVPGIVGMGKAAEICKKKIAHDSIMLSSLQQYFIDGINQINGLRLNISPENTMPNVVNVCVGIKGGDRMLNMISKHVAASSGSACSSALVEPSHVLKAMDICDEDALASIRFSFGRNTTFEELDIVLDAIKKSVLSIQSNDSL
jgi:cysteine desulfurase